MSMIKTAALLLALSASLSLSAPARADADSSGHHHQKVWACVVALKGRPGKVVLPIHARSQGEAMHRAQHQVGKRGRVLGCHPRKGPKPSH